MKKLFIHIRNGMLLLIMLTAGLKVCLAQAPQQNQNNQSAKDRIEALRIAFISQQLNLTPDEAQKFWPIYNAYRSESEGLHKGYPAQLSADQQLELEQKKLDLKKKYKSQFELALGTEKLNQLYNLERKFQEKLKEIREQRMQQQRGGQGRPNR
jgi:hypothetical protein